ncbi:hypothetical protein GCM10023096_67650 [Nonomuraea ferruginea]
MRGAPGGVGGPAAERVVLPRLRVALPGPAARGAGVAPVVALVAAEPLSPGGPPARASGRRLTITLPGPAARPFLRVRATRREVVLAPAGTAPLGGTAA